MLLTTRLYFGRVFPKSLVHYTGDLPKTHLLESWCKQAAVTPLKHGLCYCLTLGCGPGHKPLSPSLYYLNLKSPPWPSRDSMPVLTYIFKQVSLPLPNSRHTSPPLEFPKSGVHACRALCLGALSQSSQGSSLSFLLVLWRKDHLFSNNLNSSWPSILTHYHSWSLSHLLPNMHHHDILPCCYTVFLTPTCDCRLQDPASMSFHVYLGHCLGPSQNQMNICTMNQ